MKRIACLAVLLCAASPAFPRSILAVWGHPDDETVIGPLLAKYAREGHKVSVVIITSGQKGFTPNTPIKDGAELGRVRNGEAVCSAQALGMEAPILLGYQDQGISAQPEMNAIVDKLIAIIDQKSPDVMITWGADGVTGHPDHRIAGALATEAFQRRATLKHRPRKLYYVAWPESLNDKLRKAFDMVLRTTADTFITTEIASSEADLSAAYRSIQCHKTQWSVERMKSRDEMNRGTLGGKAYLRLALSDVPRHSTARERDLFEGLP